jgi:hypothetical protein
MSKIQILNETQVNHFNDVLRPELERAFDAIVEKLEKQAKDEKDDFLTHKEVVELIEKQTKKVELAKQTIEITKQLKELQKDLYISNGAYRHDIITTQEELDELLKDQKESLDNLLIKLSGKNLNVNSTWARKEQMYDDLKARLCMAVVDNFDTITKLMRDSIKVDSYFENKL